MFGLGLPELFLIFLIGLLIFGPKKIPEMAKSMGKGISEFKKATRETQRELNGVLEDQEKPITAAAAATVPAPAASEQKQV